MKLINLGDIKTSHRNLTIVIPTEKKYTTAQVRQLDLSSGKPNYSSWKIQMTQLGGRWIGIIPTNILSKGQNHLIASLNTATTVFVDEIDIYFTLTQEYADTPLSINGKDKTLSSAVADIHNSMSKNYLVQTINKNGLRTYNYSFDSEPVMTYILPRTNDGDLVSNTANLFIEYTDLTSMRIEEIPLMAQIQTTDCDGFEVLPIDMKPKRINLGGVAKYVHIFPEYLRAKDGTPLNMNCGRVAIVTSYIDRNRNKIRDGRLEINNY